MREHTTHYDCGCHQAEIDRLRAENEALKKALHDHTCDADCPVQEADRLRGLLREASASMNDAQMRHGRASTYKCHLVRRIDAALSLAPAKGGERCPMSDAKTYCQKVTRVVGATQLYCLLPLDHDGDCRDIDHMSHGTGRSKETKR